MSCNCLTSKLPVEPPKKSAFWVPFFFACVGLFLCLTKFPAIGGVILFGAFLNLAAGTVLRNQ